MKRAACSRVPEKRHAARMKLEKVLQAIIDIGIGETVTAGEPGLRKFRLGTLSRGSISWLRDNRVPLHMIGTHAITSPAVVDSTSLQEDRNTEVVKAATQISAPSRHMNTVPLAEEFPQAASLLQTPSTRTDYAKPAPQTPAGQRTGVQQPVKSLSTELFCGPILSECQLSKHLNTHAKYRASRGNCTKRTPPHQRALLGISSHEERSPNAAFLNSAVVTSPSFPCPEDVPIPLFKSQRTSQQGEDTAFAQACAHKTSVSRETDDSHAPSLQDADALAAPTEAGVVKIYRSQQLWSKGVLEGLVRTPSQISTHLRQLFRKAAEDVEVRFVRTNRQTMKHRALCLVQQCPVVWHCTYHLTAGHGIQQGMLCVTQVDQHVHTSDTAHRLDTGRIWTAAQQSAANDYLQHAAALRSRDLERYLLNRGFSLGDLPSRSQRNDWLKRQRRSDPVPTPHTNIPVDTARHIVERLVIRDQSDLQSHELYVLPDYCINEDFVFIPFSCPTFHTCLSKYTGSALIIGTDGKHKMLRNGWPVLSVGYIIKKNQPNTTFKRVGPHASKIQGPGSVCSFVPLIQAVVHSENKDAYAKIYEAMTSTVAGRLAVLQIHKNFAAAAEVARHDIWPGSRPMNDWAHFLRNVRKHCMSTRGLMGQVLPLLNMLRVLPTIQLFSQLWHGLLVWLQRMPGGQAFAAYLQNVYTVSWKSTSLQEPRLMWCEWAAGCTFTAPGSASGTQCVEAFHRQWDAEFFALGAPPPLDGFFDRMQTMYHKWCPHLPTQMHGYSSDSETIPLSVPKLHALGRCAVQEYWQNKHLPNFCVHASLRWGQVVVISARATDSMSYAHAASVVQALDGEGRGLWRM